MGIIMGVFTYESETTTVITPARLFKAFVLDADNLIPKVAPQAIKSSEIIEGSGGPGTIKKITFGEGSQFNYVKHRIDEIDNANFIYACTLIEGDAISETLEKIAYEIKLDQIKAGKEEASGIFKAVEAYLLANPDAYN